MDGGVDAVIKRHLGAGIQLRVQRAIRDQFGGSLPVGSAVCVPSGATKVCANLMWTGYTLFNDYYFRDYDDLRKIICEQLDDIESRPEEERVRVTPPRHPAPADDEVTAPRG